MSDCRAGSQTQQTRSQIAFVGSLIEAEGKSTDFLRGEILTSLNSGSRKATCPVLRSGHPGACVLSLRLSPP